MYSSSPCSQNRLQNNTTAVASRWKKQKNTYASESFNVLTIKKKKKNTHTHTHTNQRSGIYIQTYEINLFVRTLTFH